MTAQTFLGIDAGGTHTDAVLCGPEGILAGAKCCADYAENTV